MDCYVVCPSMAKVYEVMRTMRKIIGMNNTKKEQHKFLFLRIINKLFKLK